MADAFSAPPQANFIRFASFCCFLSVITTLGIHLYFPDPPADFEERILMFRDTTYLVNRWWVIAHCLLVVVAMWGFALVQFRKSRGPTGIGFLFFSVFAIAEITRQMIVLFYINGLREQYFTATDETIKASLRPLISQSGLLTSPLFGVFIMAFGIGCLCYGLSMVREKGFSRLISGLLILSGLISFVFLGNSFWRIAALGKFIENYNNFVTPSLRVMIGIWLWLQYKSLQQKTVKPVVQLT